MTIYVPYTYLIGWRNHNKWYYGAQFNKTANPSDLWVTYFTSSKVVAAFRHQYGEPDVIEIRKTFTSKEKCLFWENAVLRKLNAAKSNLWLNKSNGAKDFYRIPGFKQSQETKDKIAKASIGNAANKGKIFSDEHKRKISLALKGRIVTDEWRKNNSEAQKGKKLSKETIEKRTKTLQENKRKEKELGIKKARKPFPENYKKNLSIAQRKRREREKMEKNKCQSFTDGL